MHRRSGAWAVRLTLGTLLFAALAMSLATPAQAGTPEAPEIADPRGDVEGPSGAPACQATPGTPATGASQCAAAPGFVDLAFGWVSNETAIDVQLYIDSGNNANSYGSADYDFHFTIAGTDYVAGMHAQMSDPSGRFGDGTAGPTGVATAAAWNDDLNIQITVPKSAIGNPAVGATMTNLFLTSHLDFLGMQEAFTDSSDPGLDYVFTGGAGGNVTVGDSDGDGLNDTCETTYFGGLNSTANATGDADGDGLTNGQECALGTDPTKADTDGDGVNDKDDPFPTDPERGGVNRTTSSSTSTSRSSTTHPPSSTSKSKGSVTDLAGAIDRLQSDPGYLGMSAGGFLAVLVLCIIGLAVRWSL